ncbi:hypothetical protein JA1_004441 [Spathaspora sp. JA1]|nr:hypothetical protein JA1_004441 [Spathaspora sp. JA1]
MSLRLLVISDIQGNIDSLTNLYQSNPVDIIISTGNFGFWDLETIETDTDLNYLKQIVAFSSVLEPQIIEELNDLSTINGTGSYSTDEISKFKTKLTQSKNGISQFSQYVDGQKALPCPVYTIFGPLDDPRIVNQIQMNTLQVPNLYLIDHTHNYEIKTTPPDIPNIKLYGLGGALKMHSLFDSGTLTYNSVSGKPSELWITLLQIAELYLNVTTTQNMETLPNQKSINIFITYAPVIKTPLLEHLAIITNADFTISQGLHFRSPVMGNGMSFVDSSGGSAGYIENYRSKFSRLRMILSEIWLVIKKDIEELLEESSSSNLKNLLELGLSLFDKISVPVNDPSDKIVPLSLYEENDPEINRKVIKKLNDYYFQAYYNLWHFNPGDFAPNSEEHNYMIFKLDERGNFKLDQCYSQGFNFNFKLNENEQELVTDKTINEEDELDDELINPPPYLKNTRGSRGRGGWSSRRGSPSFRSRGSSFRGRSRGSRPFSR